jgi:uncharacterized protein (DUF362 family)
MPGRRKMPKFTYSPPIYFKKSSKNHIVTKKQYQKRIGRREFLLKSLALGITTSLPSLFHPLPETALAKTRMGEEVDLAVISGSASPATRRAIDLLGGIKRFVRPGDKVALKPNISFPNPPHLASTTHPQVVATVAKECLAAGARKILVLDYPLRNPELCLKRSKVQEACQKIEKTYVLGLTERKFFQRSQVYRGKVLKEVEIMREVLSSDVLINLPVAKSHSATTVSLGMKNLMGLIWDRRSFHAKMDINQAIADLNTVIRPKLTIIDATRALVSGGPSGPGKVLKLNMVVAGTDPVAVDAYGVTLCPWYGRKFTGREIKHILAAHERRLGKIDLDKLNIQKGRV